MDRLRVPIAVALAGVVATAAVALAPVVRLAVPWDDLALYWSAGVGGLWVVLALGAVLAIVAAAVATGRTDPATGLGIAFGIALVLAAAALLWAVNVDGHLVAELSPATWFAYHRWLLVLVAVVPAAAIGWGAVRADIL